MSRQGTQRNTSATPLVSIGVPVRNGAKYVGEALESLLTQNYQRLEVIVSDNASEDDTETVCRRFANDDPRIRYLRNSTDIGLLPNFRLVRREARGKYFSWLCHDDLLSDRAYLDTVVSYLEQHPDVVCCHTSMSITKADTTTPAEVLTFPELGPERRWEDARRDLFRWPDPWLELASHGVFRREELVKLPIRDRTRTGRPNIFCWEINLLTALAQRGRIVALPECLRTYRSSEYSIARRMGRSVSSFDLVLLGLETKLTLLFRAFWVQASLIDRCRLVGTTVGNFPRSTFRRRFDHRTAARMLRGEFALLRRTARERSDLIRSLGNEVSARRETLRTRQHGDGRSIAHADSYPAEDLAIRDDSLPRVSRGFLADFFLPPSDDQLQRMEELNERVRDLRSHCENQLRTINRLHTEASELLESPPPDGS